MEQGLKVITPSLCVRCKGRLFCGLTACPILDKVSNARRVEERIHGTDFSGPTPPSVFVGRHDYPNLSIGPLSTPVSVEDADLLENPQKWFGLPQEKVIEFRQLLVNSRVKERTGNAAHPTELLASMQELAISKKPVELEVELFRRPRFHLSLNDNSAPHGPTGELKKLELAENPKPSKHLGKAFNDSDLKALEAVSGLYSKGVEVHRLSNALSAGAFGVGEKRKLVPTRWSITAVDSMLSQKLVDEIKGFAPIAEFELFHSNYLDNNFWVVLAPMTWAFELIEAWFPNSNWNFGSELVVSNDFESNRGRKDYAENTAGAYYASRLGVAEYLHFEKKQAGALVLREIGPEYKTPVGVWQVRENVRNAMNSKPLTFASLELALKFLDTRFKCGIERFREKSALLREYKTQRRLFEFF